MSVCCFPFFTQHLPDWITKFVLVIYQVPQDVIHIVFLNPCLALHNVQLVFDVQAPNLILK